MDLRGTSMCQTATAIPGLISMQEQAQLISGQATLSAQQSMNEVFTQPATINFDSEI